MFAARKIRAAGVGAVVAVCVAAGASVDAATGYLNIAAIGMTKASGSGHNQTGDTDCNVKAASSDGIESNGSMSQGWGQFFQTADLPQGATVTRLTVYGLDNDASEDMHAYLMRRRYGVGSDISLNYLEMARADSNGVGAVVRKFDDNSIQSPVVNTSNAVYLVELLVCSQDLQPISIRVDYTTPDPEP